MKSRSFDIWVWVLAPVLVSAWLFVSPAEAQGVQSPAQVSKRIEATFGVRVLRVQQIKDEGPLTYAVTVMNAGGNYNEAFQVTTLVVNPKTGTLISQFRHKPAGYRLSGAPLNSATTGGDGALIRRLTHRR